MRHDGAQSVLDAVVINSAAKVGLPRHMHTRLTTGQRDDKSGKGSEESQSSDAHDLTLNAVANVRKWAKADI